MMKTLLCPLILAAAVLSGCGGDDEGTSGGLMCASTTPATCGNGVIDPGEACDQGDGTNADFGNATCGTLMMGTGVLQCRCCELLTEMCIPTGDQTPGIMGGGGNGG